MILLVSRYACDVSSLISYGSEVMTKIKYLFMDDVEIDACMTIALRT